MELLLQHRILELCMNERIFAWNDARMHSSLIISTALAPVFRLSIILFCQVAAQNAWPRAMKLWSVETGAKIFLKFHVLPISATCFRCGNYVFSFAQFSHENYMFMSLSAAKRYSFSFYFRLNIDDNGTIIPLWPLNEREEGICSSLFFCFSKMKSRRFFLLPASSR